MVIDRFGQEYRDAVTSVDLLAGDFGNGSMRTILDAVRQAKRRGICRECLGPICKGEITRVVKMVDNDGFYGGRCCQACCDAMAISWRDGGRAIEARHALRMANSQP